MSGNYFVRDIPPHVDAWVKEGMLRTGLKKTEFIRQVLQHACEARITPRLFDATSPVVKPVPRAIPFKFVDLFAGIGGFRIGLTKAGGHCVFTCEYDRYARRTYCAWFNELDESIFGDINQLVTDEDIERRIPDHDVLAAGFPCQPFSIAGVSKKNSLGMAHGFDDRKQGNLFFKIRDIVRVKRPPVLFLENVKNLKSHDGGRTWQVIRGTLEDELGYAVFDRIIDASAWVPQHRERILIVCFDKRVFGGAPDFEFAEPPQGRSPVLGDILEPRPDSKFVLTDHLWDYLQQYAEKHRRAGNGFGFGLFGPGDRTRTLSARYYKDGSEILIRPPAGGHPSISDPKRSSTNPRRLTIREAARLMGFADDDAALFGHANGFPQVVSDMQAYKQFGNSVVPAVVEHAAKGIVRALGEHVLLKGCLIKGRSSVGDGHHGGRPDKAAAQPMHV